MFSIAVQQDLYKTYILSDQLAQSRLEVVPERGGIATRWSVQGHEMFYLDTERFTNPSLSVRGGIPILFPICGNLPDNTYTHNGKPYTLKQHGFARDMAWEVSDRYTQDWVGLTLTLSSDDNTRAVYPFDFQLIFTYRLQGNSLDIHQQILNRSNEPMPFAIGLHPYFAVTDKDQLRFDIPATEFQNLDQSVRFFAGTFDFNRDEIDVIFQEPASNISSVIDSERQLKLQLAYESPYCKVVFWTVKGKDFYCLEPWSAPRNAMNTGDRLTLLAPGASVETLVRFTVTNL